MIVILANSWSSAAEALSKRWGMDAGLLTPADLSVVGWVQHHADPSADTVVVGGRRLPQREIIGVLPLMHGIFEEELTWIVPEDRAYVAAEMTAFLLSWLTRLRCRVLNRPTPPCLSGPFWRPERWVHLAAGAGVPTQSLRRSLPDEHAASPLGISPGVGVVTVIGAEAFGEVDRTLREHALALARGAGVELLEVQFSSREADALFVAAHTMPDLTLPPLADAVLALLRTESAP